MTSLSLLAAKRGFVAALALAGILACSNSAEPDVPFGDGIISTSRADANLRIHNRSSTALRVAVVTQLQFNSGLANYCFGIDDCGRPIPAGASIDVTRDELTGSSRSPTPVYVFYWQEGLSTPTTHAPLNRIEAVLPPSQ